jgi:hypothetical protein
VRPASTAAALIEKDDAIPLRVEEASHPRIGAGTGSAVEEDCWLSLRVTAFLEIDAVIGVDGEVSRAVGLDGRVERLNSSRFLACHMTLTSQSTGRTVGAVRAGTLDQRMIEPDTDPDEPGEPQRLSHR